MHKNSKVGRPKKYKQTSIPFRNGKISVQSKVTKRHTKHPVGRPPIEVDWKRVYRMAKIHCTVEEIGFVLGVHHQTLNNKPEFQELYQRGWNYGKMSLRRAQFNCAIKEGNPTMMIWLGKNVLGQKDRIYNEVDLSGTVHVDAIKRQNLSILSVEELQQFRTLLAKAEGVNIIDVIPASSKAIPASKVNGSVKVNGKARP